MQYTDKYRSPLGEITLASDGDHLTGLWFDGQKYFAATLSAEHQERELPIFEQAKEWLDSYFMGKIPSFTPPIHLEDTPFRLAVWDLLSKIPYGEVVTYKELAGEIARQKGIPSMSTQAIGGAVGHNPISIIIPWPPCRRQRWQPNRIRRRYRQKKEPAYNRTGPKSIVKRLYLANPCGQI